LRLAGAQYADLDGVIVADGPGSFTGLRIGFATARGILREYDRFRLLTAPSLLAAAWGARQFVRGPIAALYDALRGQVFAAVYAFEGSGVRTHVAPGLTSVAELAARSPVVPALAVGDGATAFAEAVRSWTGKDPVGFPAGAPRAAALLELLDVEGAVTPVEDPAAFEPCYGRPAEAQARWELKHGRPLPDPGGDFR
jgi:tRNA threonylcarbamoyladenosine biosynthesis protein TsaB